MEQKLTLFPDTFLWMKKDRILLYNAKTFDIADFVATNGIRAQCEKLCNYDNLYSVPINDLEGLAEDLRNWVRAIAGKFGMLTTLDNPIISLPPLLNIQNDIERLRKDKDRDIRENLLDYLTTLTVYIGGNHSGNKEYYRQIIYPVCHNEVLDVLTIASYLKEIFSSSLQTINLVVSNITDLDVISIRNLLAVYKEQITFYFSHPITDDEMLVTDKLIKEGYKIRFICEATFYKPEADLKIENMIANDKKSLLAYEFIVKNDKEYKYWTKVIETYKRENYQFVPVYDNNEDYFKENIFLTESEIRESCLSRREIFAHQAINTLYFGTLTIMPDKKIYSDVNNPALGTIRDPIYDVILQEIEKNYIWRRIRNTDKCNQCIYQWLCPSPTQYEKAMNVECVCTY